MKKGDNVWLEDKNIYSNWPSKKLDQKIYKPFKENIGLEAFQLELLKGWVIHNMFNEDLLTLCKEPQFKKQHMDLALPPDIINEEEEYKVKEVWNHRKQEYGIQFLVYWKGYGNKHDQWIVESELPHAKKVIEDYWVKISSWNL